MSITVNVTSNANQVIMEMKAMATEMREKATVRALNRTIEQVRTQASREVRAAGYNLKAAVVRATMKMHRASAGRLWARVVASGRPIPLVQYSARQTRKGVTVNVMNGRKLVPGAFIAKMRNGKIGVFEREMPQRKRTKANKYAALPVRHLHGPSIPAALANAKVQQALQRLIEQKFPEILAREARFIIDRPGRGGAGA